MSKPKKRRRFLLPMMASGLLSAAGGGGYWFYTTSQPEVSQATQSDLDSGFESAQGNDTLGNMTAAWDRQTKSGVVQAAAHEPIADVPALDELPELPAASRYESVDATPVAELPAVDALPPIEMPEVADPAGRMTDSEPMPETPRDANAVVARGQSPLGELPAIEPLPGGNPLRTASNAFDASEPVANSGAAAAASAEPPPMTELAASDSMPTELANVGPDPAAELEGGNPLRASASPVSVPTPAPIPSGFDAAPLDAQPMEATQPVQVPEPAPFDSRGGLGQLDSPNELEPQMASLEPTPVHQESPLASSSAAQGTGRPGERALEGPQRPSLVLQKFAPQEIQVGKECTFVLKVRNVGQRPADNVVVDDEVPHGTRFVSASPQGENLGSNIAWKLGTLSPGEERTLEVRLMPTEEGEIGSVAQVTFSSHASAKSRCTKPQLALRMSAPSEVLVGRQQRVSIEIHNPGTGDATGVVLLENVPENVRHQAGPALEFEVGTLRAGETRRMELVLTAEKAGHVVNLLTARADGNLQVQQEVEFEVISPALAVAVKGPARRYLERPATYTVSVDNPGTAPAQDVQLVTKLPRGLKFVRANNLGEYDSATHSVYWSLAELPEGEHGTVELVALPIQSGDHTIEVEGRAREGLEDRTTQPVRVEGLAAIQFTVTDAQDPIEVGGTTSYEIRVVNQGSKAATNVQITAQVPPGMAVTNAQGETRHSVQSEGVVFQPLARLAPKAETIYRVDVQGVRPGDQRLMVEVRTDDIAQPIRKEESTRVFGDE